MTVPSDDGPPGPSASERAAPPDAAPAEAEADPFAAAVESFLERRRAGDVIDVEAYARSFGPDADELRDILDALVLAENAGERFASPGPGDASSERDAVRSVGSVLPGTRLGPYRVVREIGRGGMGVVFEAEDTELGRRVALKVLRPGTRLDSSALERFRREARAVAGLKHSSIVPVHGFAESDGHHFYAMQLIDGQPLDRVIAELRARDDRDSTGAATRTLLPPTSSPRSDATGRDYFRRVAEIGLALARALAHAHAYGVRHRDIKPSNILLGVDGVPWLADFGLARIAETETLTASGEILGTVAYMAPECFSGHPGEPADIYGLGLCLWELVSLRPAFRDTDRRRLIRRVLDEEPPRLALLEPRVPEDLATVIETAIVKEAGSRYPSAEALADDLDRFRHGRPILARRPGRIRRIARWARREPVLAGVSMLALVAVLALVVGTAWYAARLAGFETQLRAREQEAIRNLYDARMNLVAMAVSAGNWQRAERLLPTAAEAGAAPGSETDSTAHDLRGFEWHHVRRQLERGVEIAVSAEPSPLCLAVSLDGERIATGHRTGVIEIRTRGEPSARRLKGHTSAVTGLAFSRRGLLASGGEDGRIRIYSVDGIELATYTHGAPVDSFGFSPSGASLACVSWILTTPEGGQISILETTELSLRRRLNRLNATRVAFLDDDLVVTGTALGEVRVEDLRSGGVLRELSGRTSLGIVSFAVSPDGEMLHAASQSRTRPPYLRCSSWRIADGAKIAETGMSSHGARRLAASAGRTRAAFAVGPTGVVVIDMLGGTILTQLPARTGGSMGIAFARESELITLSDSGRIESWDLELDRAPCELRFDPAIRRVSLDRSGRRLVAATKQGSVAAWDLHSGRRLVSLRLPPPEASAAVSPDGTWLVAASHAQAVTRYEIADGRPIWTQDELPARSATEPGHAPFDVSSDGRVVAIVSGDGRSVFLVDAATGKVRQRLRREGTDLDSIRGLESRSRLGIVASTAATLCLWDEESWAAGIEASPVPRTLRLPAGAVGTTYSISTLGRLVGAAGMEILEFDLTSGARVAAVRDTRHPTRVAFLGESRLASVAETGAVTFWDTDRWIELASFQAHDAWVNGLDVSDDGHVLVTGDDAGVIRIWRGAPSDDTETRP